MIVLVIEETENNIASAAKILDSEKIINPEARELIETKKELNCPYGDEKGREIHDIITEALDKHGVHVVECWGSGPVKCPITIENTFMLWQ